MFGGPTKLDFYDKRGRHRTPPIFKTEHSAQVFLLENFGKRSIALARQVKLAAFCEWYCQDQLTRGYGTRTSRQDKSRYQRRLWGPLNNAAIADISVEQLEALPLQWQALAPTTVRDTAYSIIRLFEAAWDLGIVQGNNAEVALAELTRAHGRGVTRIATHEDVDKIIGIADDRLKLALHLAMDGCLSEAELAALCISDFTDFSEMKVRFRVESGEEVMQPRPTKFRTVSLSAKTTELLRSWWNRTDRPEGSPYIFAAPDGTRINYPVVPHLRRAQYRLRMKLVDRVSAPKRRANVKHRRKPYQLFEPKWTLGAITDMRVVEWYAAKIGKKEILRRCGLKKLERLDRFNAYFNEIDQRSDAFDAVDDMLEGARE
ncbi:site-specific integrase [Devosia sp. Leaf420]|uniref:site-specific integrase n=1 Tax=Devosia sp. Leaf420 TaxID=1736374 RepID=UPI000AC926D7|nr:site-specific integrase [Devosia sp. Leaf420]